MANPQLKHFTWALVTSPILLFAGYVAYLVVPEVVRVVVPLVVEEVTAIVR